MKFAGKKAGLMPSSKADIENAADAKKPGDAKEDTTKKTGTFKGKSNKLGGGGRFAQLQAKGMSGGLAATIGRKLYGKTKFQSMAAAGKKSA